MDQVSFFVDVMTRWQLFVFTLWEFIFFPFRRSRELLFDLRIAFGESLIIFEFSLTFFFVLFEFFVCLLLKDLLVLRLSLIIILLFLLLLHVLVLLPRIFHTFVNGFEIFMTELDGVLGLISQQFSHEIR